MYIASWRVDKRGLVGAYNTEIEILTKVGKEIYHIGK
jgi:hypothetical protein